MRSILVIVAMAIAVPATAQDMSAFKTGPVFAEFGRHVAVDHNSDIGAHTRLKVAFDVANPAADGKYNTHIESAARFMNMSVANGVEREHIKLAVVVHGGASMDLLNSEAWKAAGRGDENSTEPLVRALLDKGVRVILCGQSGAAHGITADQLIPGVETALSAMTAHALLQQEGYTLNPF